jgi:hypothetical protein
MVTQSEKAVLEEVYRTSKEGVHRIQTILGKVYDDDLALDLNRQAAKLSRLEEKASMKLIEKGLRPQPLKISERARKWSDIQISTLLNTSTQHVAQMVIRDNAKGMVDVLKAVKHNRAASKESYELAEELMDFSEKSMRKLRGYVKK